MSMILDGSNGVTFNDSSLQGAAASPYVLKNRIINGDMRIDQRNAGASVTPTAGQYSLDRWNGWVTQASKFTVQQNAGSVTPPAGFSYYAGITSLAATTIGASDEFTFAQTIEGYNTADLDWGTANAKTVTLSFWVRSSLTGTFGGSIYNNNATGRAYAFSYNISAANTWEYKTITIVGETTGAGTWSKTNGNGLQVKFGLGAGSSLLGTAGVWANTNLSGATGQVNVVSTNGATFYITGVQLEQNTSATPFERRLYNQELANCQRYFTMSFPQGTAPAQNAGTTGAITGQGQAANAPAYAYAPFKTTMRATPTITTYNPSAANANWRNTTAGSDINVVVSNTGDSGTFIGSNTQILNQYAFCAIHYSATAEL